MMDWDLGHWFGMVFGWGFVILAAVIILYMIIQSTRVNYNKNQVSNNFSQENIENTMGDNSERNESEKPIFCYSCGEKLEGEELYYCPSCGTKIK